jgi:hypothetical protein
LRAGEARLERTMVPARPAVIVTVGRVVSNASRLRSWLRVRTPGSLRDLRSCYSVAPSPAPRTRYRARK